MLKLLVVSVIHYKCVISCFNYNGNTSVLKCKYISAYFILQLAEHWLLSSRNRRSFIH